MKKLIKTAKGFIAAGVVTGVGGSVISSNGGNAKVMTNLSGQMPTMATVSGAGMTLGMVAKLQMKKRRR